MKKESEKIHLQLSPHLLKVHSMGIRRITTFLREVLEVRTISNKIKNFKTMRENVSKTSTRENKWVFYFYKIARKSHRTMVFLLVELGLRWVLMVWLLISCKIHQDYCEPKRYLDKIKYDCVYSLSMTCLNLKTQRHQFEIKVLLIAIENALTYGESWTVCLVRMIISPLFFIFWLLVDESKWCYIFWCFWRTAQVRRLLRL